MLLAGLTACDNSLCGNKVLDVVQSPDQQQVATLFARDCGATTAESWQVMLSDAVRRQNLDANVFIADLHAQPVFQVKNGRWVDIRWQDDGVLLVRFDNQARIFKQESIVDGVKIRYQKMVITS